VSVITLTMLEAKMHFCLPKSKSCTVVVIVLLYFIMLWPTSSKSEINSSTFDIILYYAIINLLLLFLFILNGYDQRCMIWSIIMMIYLFISTLISSVTLGTNFSLARFAPVCTIMLIMMTDLKYSLDEHLFIKSLDLLILLIIIGNIGIILGIGPVKDFFLNNYSQFSRYTVLMHIHSRKPIFTTGAHNYGACIYFIIYSLIYVVYKSQIHSKKRHFIYLVIFIVFTLMLRSSTGIVMSIFMTALILKETQKRYRVPFVMAIVFVIVLYFMMNWRQIDIDILQRLVIGNENNGFLARYTGSLFANNLIVLGKTILGIGFTIPREYAVYYADSGFLVYLTMGSIPFVIFLYYRFKQFCNKNYASLSNIFFFALILVEFAIPSLLYSKIQVLIFILAFCIRSFMKSQQENEQVQGFASYRID